MYLDDRQSSDALYIAHMQVVSQPMKAVIASVVKMLQDPPLYCTMPQFAQSVVWMGVKLYYRQSRIFAYNHSLRITLRSVTGASQIRRDDLR